MDENQVAELMALGLSRYESAVYLSLLERGDFSPSSLASRARVPRQRIYDVLASLEEKGFCTIKSTLPRVYAGVAPSIALEHYLSRKDRELHEELRRTQDRMASLVPVLTSMYEAGGKESDPFQYIEVLRTTDGIAQRSLELASGATSNVNSLVKTPLILSTEQNSRFLHEPLGRGIRYRSIYEASALSQKDVLGSVESCFKLGQEIRICEYLPVKLHTFDGKVGLLSLQDPVGGTPSFTALVTHHSGMVEALNLSFESLWNSAKEYTPHAG